LVPFFVALSTSGSVVIKIRVLDLLLKFLRDDSVDLVLTFVRNIVELLSILPLQIKALNALVIITQNLEGCNELVCGGGINHLIKLCYQECTEVVELALWVVTNVIKLPGTHPALKVNGGLEAILRHINSPEEILVSRSLKIILLLANFEENQKAIRDAGGIGVFKQLEMSSNRVFQMAARKGLTIFG